MTGERSPARLKPSAKALNSLSFCRWGKHAAMLTHNRYFDDQVQSIAYVRHGRKASVGVIAAGSYHFGTAAAERMSVLSGECRVTRDGSACEIVYPTGSAFEVAAASGFTIACDEPVAYLCEYL
jgi:uncharacterized protein YaiE (UPF0345 family)